MQVERKGAGLYVRTLKHTGRYNDVERFKQTGFTWLPTVKIKVCSREASVTDIELLAFLSEYLGIPLMCEHDEESGQIMVFVELTSAEAVRKVLKI